MKIAIIGAGYGGMVAAYDLRKAGHDVIIYESADYVGGLASGFKEPHWDWSVEKFYHHWFQSDSSMLGLMICHSHFKFSWGTTFHIFDV